MAENTVDLDPETASGDRQAALVCLPAMAREDDKMLGELNEDFSQTQRNHRLVDTTLLLGAPVATAVAVFAVAPLLPLALGVWVLVSVAGLGIQVNLETGRAKTLDLKRRNIAKHEEDLRRRLRRGEPRTEANSLSSPPTQEPK